MKPYPIRVLKDPLFENLSRIGKAISSPKRLEILDLLAHAPHTVEALAQLTGLTVANTSQHLQILKASRLVESQKNALYVRYWLASGVEKFYLGLRGLGEQRLIEIEHTRRMFLEERGLLEGVSGEELLRRALSGEVTVLDVRPEEEFRASHLPGAWSVPLSDLVARLGEIPNDREVVAYCRGPYCVFAMEAVEVLREAGFVAHVLAQGPPEWRGVGVELVVGA